MFKESNAHSEMQVNACIHRSSKCVRLCFFSAPKCQNTILIASLKHQSYELNICFHLICHLINTSSTGQIHKGSFTNATRLIHQSVHVKQFNYERLIECVLRSFSPLTPGFIKHWQTHSEQSETPPFSKSHICANST